ncbi:unnamed protein product [Protopolystoma xenopodis]|uniref:Uncharacterized protein n=1 Tax=Protopolystoma xenopodis TaxID=117903 RepID=A0A3S5ASU3_9PLAT|nr:unnamed protein product [Protopolystoma xenopodis]
MTSRAFGFMDLLVPLQFTAFVELVQPGIRACYASVSLTRLIWTNGGSQRSNWAGRGNIGEIITNDELCRAKVNRILI